MRPPYNVKEADIEGPPVVPREKMYLRERSERKVST
jgi:hypothetical protein